jgi:hypothetical protein
MSRHWFSGRVERELDHLGIRYRRLHAPGTETIVLVLDFDEAKRVALDMVAYDEYDVMPRSKMLQRIRYHRYRFWLAWQKSVEASRLARCTTDEQRAWVRAARLNAEQRRWMGILHTFVPRESVEMSALIRKHLP